MPTPPQSADELRMTQGSIITEDKGEFMGLPGGTIFVPMGVFILTQAVTNTFPVSLCCAGASFLVIKLWLRGKPQHFLSYWLWERAAPKLYRHRLED